MARLDNFWWTLFTASLIMGCEEYPEPQDLDHARIVAIRATPPAAAPGSWITLDALVTDDDARTAVTTSFSAAIAPIGGVDTDWAAAGLTLEQTEGRWRLEVPSVEVLRAVRSELALPADEPLPVPIAIEVEIGGQLYPGQKLVWLGAVASNPRAVELAVEGEPFALPVDSIDVDQGLQSLSVAAEGGTPPYSYAWLTSVGSLESYREQQATLDIEEQDSGTVAVVVRDQLGGTDWQLIPIEE